MPPQFTTLKSTGTFKETSFSESTGNPSKISLASHAHQSYNHNPHQHHYSSEFLVGKELLHPEKKHYKTFSSNTPLYNSNNYYSKYYNSSHPSNNIYNNNPKSKNIYYPQHSSNKLHFNSYKYKKPDANSSQDSWSGNNKEEPSHSIDTPVSSSTKDHSSAAESFTNSETTRFSESCALPESSESSSSDESRDCPLCLESIDRQDMNFLPCECGYQVCRFCWHHIKSSLNDKCPACRRLYSEQSPETSCHIPIKPKKSKLSKKSLPTTDKNAKNNKYEEGSKNNKSEETSKYHKSDDKKSQVFHSTNSNNTFAIFSSNSSASASSSSSPHSSPCSNSNVSRSNSSTGSSSGLSGSNACNSSTNSGLCSSFSLLSVKNVIPLGNILVERKHLVELRVLQKNLVYVVGIPLSLSCYTFSTSSAPSSLVSILSSSQQNINPNASTSSNSCSLSSSTNSNNLNKTSSLVSALEWILSTENYFGKYGNIIKLVINLKGQHLGMVSSLNKQKNSHNLTSTTVSAFLTFENREEAIKAIDAIDGTFINGFPLKATHGTTKYCAFFLRGQACPNSNHCLYLHELGEEQNSYTKEALSARQRNNNNSTTGSKKGSFESYGHSPLNTSPSCKTQAQDSEDSNSLSDTHSKIQNTDTKGNFLEPGSETEPRSLKSSPIESSSVIEARSPDSTESPTSKKHCSLDLVPNFFSPLVFPTTPPLCKTQSFKPIITDNKVLHSTSSGGTNSSNPFCLPPPPSSSNQQLNNSTFYSIVGSPLNLPKSTSVSELGIVFDPLNPSNDIKNPLSKKETEKSGSLVKRSAEEGCFEDEDFFIQPLESHSKETNNNHNRGGGGSMSSRLSSRFLFASFDQDNYPVMDHQSNYYKLKNDDDLLKATKLDDILNFKEISGAYFLDLSNYVADNPGFLNEFSRLENSIEMKISGSRMSNQINEHSQQQSVQKLHDLETSSPRNEKNEKEDFLQLTPLSECHYSIITHSQNSPILNANNSHENPFLLNFLEASASEVEPLPALKPNGKTNKHLENASKITSKFSGATNSSFGNLFNKQGILNRIISEEEQLLEENKIYPILRSKAKESHEKTYKFKNWEASIFNCSAQVAESRPNKNMLPHEGSQGILNSPSGDCNAYFQEQHQVNNNSKRTSPRKALRSDADDKNKIPVTLINSKQDPECVGFGVHFSLDSEESSWKHLAIETRQARCSSPLSSNRASFEKRASHDRLVSIFATERNLFGKEENTSLHYYKSKSRDRSHYKNAESVAVGSSDNAREMSKEFFYGHGTSSQATVHHNPQTYDPSSKSLKAFSNKSLDSRTGSSTSVLSLVQKRTQAEYIFI